jgi:hypothetical protein
MVVDIYDRDIILGSLFLMIALLSAYRVYSYFDLSGAGKVVTIFYSLILFTASVRAVWFFLPALDFETTYAPTITRAWETSGWLGCLYSQILISLGTTSLFSVFILIACYWGEMLTRVSQPAIQFSDSGEPREFTQKRWDSLEIFVNLVFTLLAIELVNIALFLGKVFTSEDMILFDAIVLSCVSVATLVILTRLSYQIRTILTTIGIINVSSTGPHIRRILAITIATNMFFICRVSVEILIAVQLVRLMKRK